MENQENVLGIEQSTGEQAIAKLRAVADSLFAAFSGTANSDAESKFDLSRDIRLAEDHMYSMQIRREVSVNKSIDPCLTKFLSNPIGNRGQN